MVEPVPELSIRLVGSLAIGHGVVNVCAIDEEDVEPAVVVVVQQRNAATHRLYQIFVRGGRIFVLEIDTSGWGDVIELHVGSGSGGYQKAQKGRKQDPTRTMETSPHN